MSPNHTNLFLTPHTRFLALQTRNPLAASSFIYSVLTTKIYCRPTCPSRLARRANIMFHDTPVEAAAAGFRACKRCRPDDDCGAVGGLEEQRRVVERVCGMIEDERDGMKWSVRELAGKVGWTESHFCRVFKRVIGKTVGEYRIGVKEWRRVKMIEVVEKNECALNGSTRIVINTKGSGRIANFQDLGLSSEESVTWNIKGTPQSSEGFGKNLFDTMAADCEQMEDCFEFLDFGSPPPLVVSIPA